MPFARGPGGVRIHYELRGDHGPRAVLLHGLGMSSRFWFGIPDRLAAAGWRVILVDNRGVGASERPPGAYRMTDLADDVAAVLDAARAPSAFVLGISLGGMIAQEVALRHPGRVLGLGLLATTAGFPHHTFPGLRALAAFLALPFRPPSAGPPARLLLSAKGVPRALELFAPWPAAFAEHPLTRAAFFAQMAAVARHSTGSRLADIHCPTVVVAGADDALIPARNSEWIARRIPRAVLEILPDVGHAMPAEDATVVERTLGKLRELAGR